MRNYFLLLIASLFFGIAFAGNVKAEKATSVKKFPSSKPKVLQYNRDIRPILSNTCFACHGPDESSREADLRLDISEGAFAKRDGSSAIVPGNPDASLIIQRMTTTDADEIMPPADSHLVVKKEQIALIRTWIQQGAKYQPHWAFRPIKDHPIPAVQQKVWVRNGIDSFVLHRLEKEEIAPSSVASRHTLIRRVSLDLTGLPPTIEEVDAFVNDTSKDAYAKLVDRLLASPHYGERWGRHWLDQARYADTNGYTVDSPRKIWRYRDWVIDAINKDMPFDQFTIEQLAGDLLPSPTISQRIATGFHRNTLVNQEGGVDKEQFRNEAVVDRVNTTGSVWLGLTVGCAQCHTHKYDPISHKEYYQMFAFFNSGRDVNSTSPMLYFPNAEQKKEIKKASAKIREAEKALANYDKKNSAKKGKPQNAKKKTKPLNSTKNQKVKPTPREKLAARVKALQKSKDKIYRKLPSTMVMEELEKPRKTHVLIRGDFLRHGEVVKPNVISVLSSLPEAPQRHQRNRLDLAQWLVSPKNPMTARVTVNRVWTHYFGQGIVKTENDFGLQGSLPTHPKLLDWLATRFVQEGWSMKKLHRLIVMSAVYRQSSHDRIDLKEIDPNNKLLARQSRIRVDAEIVRDMCLKVSGLLSTKIGGKSVYPPQPKGVYSFTQNKMAWRTSTGESRYRRGMYTFFVRSAPYPMLTTFDTPRFDTSCTGRVRSNTPLQSLTMANDQTIQEFVRALGRKISSQSQKSQSQKNDKQKLEYVFRLCLSRSPQPVELKSLTSYLKKQRADFTADTDAAKQVAGKDVPKGMSSTEAATWTTVARVIINLDEFITRE